MKRQDIREHLFRLLFRKEFYEDPEMTEQTERYFENQDTLSDEDSLHQVESDEDRDYIIKKYDNISRLLPQIDALIEKSSKGWTIQRISKTDLTILRLAVYEAVYDDDIPVGVAIDQAVELAKKYGQDESSSFINGILSGVVK
ncbi:MAG: transcription antitermination factor NusB [Lachnospiraceae bacterium]|nr:transcription antitermination factor NusB [Lachnospiraceae bacterium]